MDSTSRYQPADYPLLSATDVAQRLHVSVRKVYLLAECQELRALRIGRQWRFRPSDFQKFVCGADKGVADGEEVRYHAYGNMLRRH
jgi:excisionase family DNA binding protein